MSRSHQLPLRPHAVRRRSGSLLLGLAVALVTGLLTPLLLASPTRAGVDTTHTKVVGDRVYEVVRAFGPDGWSGPNVSDSSTTGYSTAHDLIWGSSSLDGAGGWGGLVAYDPRSLDLVREVKPRSFAATYRTHAPDSLAVDDERNLVWASVGMDNAVLVIDQTTGEPVAKIDNVGTGSSALWRRIVLDPVLDRAYLASQDASGGTVTVIDAATKKIIDRWDAETLALPELAPGFLTADTRDGTTRLYFLNDFSRLVEVTDSAGGDPETRYVGATVTVGSAVATGLAVSRKHGRAYISGAAAGFVPDTDAGGNIVTLDLASGDVVARVDVIKSPEGHPITMTHQRPVVDETRAEVNFSQDGTFSYGTAVIDAESGQILRSGTYLDHIAVPISVIVDGVGFSADAGAARVRITDDTPPDTGDPTQARMEVIGTPRLGCPVLLRGINWLTADASQGSAISIKLDDGQFARPSGSDVWAVANGSTPYGKVEHVLTLPDGTTGPNGSRPAYTTGPHWLRLLTGSAVAGDVKRNPTIDIEVQPAGKCDPLPTDPDPDPAVDTTVTADPARQVYGQTTDLTVSVSPDATGSVSITAGAHTLTGTLADGTASVTIPATTLEPGVHDLAITYPGVEGKFNPSTGTAKVTVTKATPKVSVKAPKKVKHGKTAMITATVTATGVKPGGKVTVKIAGTKKKTVKLNAKGKAVAKIKVPKKTQPGTKKATATYAGDTHVAPGKAKTTITVKR